MIFSPVRLFFAKRAEYRIIRLLFRETLSNKLASEISEIQYSIIVSESFLLLLFIWLSSPLHDFCFKPSMMTRVGITNVIFMILSFFLLTVFFSPLIRNENFIINFIIRKFWNCLRKPEFNFWEGAGADWIYS